MTNLADRRVREYPQTTLKQTSGAKSLWRIGKDFRTALSAESDYARRRQRISRPCLAHRARNCMPVEAQRQRRQK
jgi:hypothetical protein